MAKRKFYVVWVGRKKGIFESWDECKEHVDLFYGAKYMSFTSKNEAEVAYSDGYQKYWGLKKKSKKVLGEKELAKIGLPIEDSISVDGACEGNPGIAEYQGVNTKSRIKIFHGGPFQEGTNNVMEFLALVHAISFCKKNQIKVPIYSDSKIAISWIKQKKCKTNLKATKKNAELFDLIERAEKWLLENSFDNKILKWETKAWGENPADFGRK